MCRGLILPRLAGKPAESMKIAARLVSPGGTRREGLRKPAHIFFCGATFNGVARSVMVVTHTPQDPSREGGARDGLFALVTSRRGSNSLNTVTPVGKMYRFCNAMRGVVDVISVERHIGFYQSVREDRHDTRPR